MTFAFVLDKLPWTFADRYVTLSVVTTFSDRCPMGHGMRIVAGATAAPGAEVDRLLTKPFVFKIPWIKNAVGSSLKLIRM